MYDDCRTVHEFVKADGEEIFLEPFESRRITDLPTVTYVPDNTPGSGVDELRFRWTVVEG